MTSGLILDAVTPPPWSHPSLLPLTSIVLLSDIHVSMHLASRPTLCTGGGWADSIPDGAEIHPRVQQDAGALLPACCRKCTVLCRNVLGEQLQSQWHQRTKKTDQEERLHYWTPSRSWSRREHWSNCYGQTVEIARQQTDPVPPSRGQLQEIVPAKGHNPPTTVLCPINGMHKRVFYMAAVALIIQ